MQQTIFKMPAIRGITPEKPKFKLFIACEDQATFTEANKVQELVESLCGKDIETARVYWNFALLRHDQLRQYAVTEAAEADMVVISFRGNGEIPEHVRAFLENLPVRPQAGQAALVVLIGPEKKTALELRPQLSYLRDAADRRGLDFFCNQDRWERMNFFQPAASVIEERVLTLETIISHHVPWSSGGIND